MSRERFFNHCLIGALILCAGIGFALVLPGFDGSHSLAVQIEARAQGSAPEAKRYYVSETGDGSDGSSWLKAYNRLQDVLDVAVTGDEIWVARGVYTPGNKPNDSFNLVPGVELYGGFSGTETSRSQRDWDVNPTVLSGDIDSNDTTDTNGIVNNTKNITGDNANHVVAADGTSGTPIIKTTLLDGFTITAGYADGGGLDDLGGGFICKGENSGSECSPKLMNVTFSGNYAKHNGGAMYNNGDFSGSSNPQLTSVNFSGNRAGNCGGAMVNDSDSGGTSSPNLRNVTFSGNYAGNCAGAMFNYGYVTGTSSPSLINVAFLGNRAGGDGGAMFNNGSSHGTCEPNLNNVIFSGNYAGGNGGAMFNNGDYHGTCEPSLTNATISGNFAVRNAGGIYNFSGNDGINNSEIRNSIIWKNTDLSPHNNTIRSNIYNQNAATVIVNSLVLGSFPMGDWIGGSYFNGGGNIDENPQFVSDIDEIAPTTTGNLRLQSNSPAIDAGDNSFITGIPTDLNGEPRIVDGDLDGIPAVDMGAYEYQIPYIYDVNLPLALR